MANFFSSSEEENLELLSSWWKKYKYLSIFLVLSVVVGIIFTEVWTESSAKALQQETQEYQALLESLDGPDSETKTLAEEFVKKYPKNIYANIAALHLAKIYISTGELVLAANQLSRVLEQTSSNWRNEFDPVHSTARLRLAKVLLAQEKPKEALKIINQSQYLNGALFELRGDAEAELNKINEARISYTLALESTQSTALKTLIKMKIADLKIDED